MKRIIKQIYFPLIALLSACAVTLSSCDNEVDINAQWREVIVVYGLLNSNDSVQFIRVGKAYQNTNSGALQIAKISDSLYLDSADVFISATDNSMRAKLQEVNYLSKDSGLFANDVNPLYKLSSIGPSAILDNKRYIIEVISKKTGQRVWAETPIVGRATVYSPFRDSNSNFTVSSPFITLSMKPGTNSKAYDIKLQVKYQEFSKNDTLKKTSKIATWDLLTNVLPEPNVNILYKIPNSSFTQFLTSKISTDTSLYRRMQSVSLFVYGGSQNLVDYISVNEPSIGIVQKQAEYSNINGGTGLFASRCVQSIQNVRFDPGSIAFLRNNAETKSLNILP